MLNHCNLHAQPPNTERSGTFFRRAVSLQKLRELQYLLHKEVVASPSLEEFKAKLEYPGLEEAVPAHGRRLELDKI